MTPTERRQPLLFLDVDGVLIPFGGCEHLRHPPELTADTANPPLARVDPALGPADGTGL